MTKKILIGLMTIGLIGFFVWAVRGLIEKEEELQVAQEQAKMSEQAGEEGEGEQKEAENANEQLSVGAEDTGQNGSDSASEREAGEQVSEEGAGQTAVADDVINDTANDAEETAGANPAGSTTPEKQAVEVEQREDGLKIEVMKEGSGQRSVKKGDVVTVHYTGQLLNGEKFDSSLDRGVPFEFTIGEGKVIQGWERGILGMKVGEKRDLTIPSELGYGSAGAGNVIPPNADLIFEVELLGIK